jgi:hypothetical protein
MTTVAIAPRAFAQDPCAYLRQRRNPTWSEISACRARDPFGASDSRKNSNLPGFFKSEIPQDELQKKRYQQAVEDYRQQKRAESSADSIRSGPSDLDAIGSDEQFGFESGSSSSRAKTLDLREKLKELDPPQGANARSGTPLK